MDMQLDNSLHLKQINERSPSVYDLFISLVAFLSLVVVLGLFFFNGHSELISLLSYIDLFVCGLFFIDFLRNLYLAKSKFQYLKGWGLIDLAASIPVVDSFRFLRITRLLRIARAIKSIRVITKAIKSDGRNAVLALVILALIFGVVISCFGVLYFELKSPLANILTSEDAIWWSICTVSTVGYGDYYPVTSGGRLFAVVLMSLGIGAFASFAGIMTDLVRSLGKNASS